ncbi:hypothetical protein F0562_018292 [Nyssa sinensis]|uniref:Bulb-type lectin domain-containing protein n=1 Tax=Nyssa sinensis TaxID=561372 RepID=A0A5J4Z8S5_9ASTE|nr:hypothetical protein F0562_018292 [Nyssa sinensis]
MADKGIRGADVAACTDVVGNVAGEVYNANMAVMTWRLRLMWHNSDQRGAYALATVGLNRGKPVRENATLTFISDGNLILSYDVDGKVAWQTGTANKGVALRSIGPKRLVSRLSNMDPSDGPYSYSMEQRYLVMSYKSKNSQKPLLYYRSDEFGNGKGSLANLVFTSAPESIYNVTYSMLRVDKDGNLRIYTYEEHIDWGAWEVTFRLFDRDNGWESQCKMPRRCGSLGVCEDDQCMECRWLQSLLGWSKSCAPPVQPASMQERGQCGLEQSCGC